MYHLVLVLHSWLRWFALVAGVAATFRSTGSRPESGADRANMWGLVLMAVLDLQMLLGLLLYFVLSPLMAVALRDFGAAVKDPGLRFFAVQHFGLMLAAVVVVHVGRVLARKATAPDSKRMHMFICFGLATLLMILSIPWPGMVGGRPLFRI